MRKTLLVSMLAGFVGLTSLSASANPAFDDAGLKNMESYIANKQAGDVLKMSLRSYTSLGSTYREALGDDIAIKTPYGTYRQHDKVFAQKIMINFNEAMAIIDEAIRESNLRLAKWLTENIVVAPINIDEALFMATKDWSYTKVKGRHNLSTKHEEAALLEKITGLSMTEYNDNTTAKTVLLSIYKRLGGTIKESGDDRIFYVVDFTKDSSEELAKDKSYSYGLRDARLRNARYATQYDVSSLRDNEAYDISHEITSQLRWIGYDVRDFISDAHRGFSESVIDNRSE